MDAPSSANTVVMPIFLQMRPFMTFSSRFLPRDCGSACPKNRQRQRAAGQKPRGGFATHLFRGAAASNTRKLPDQVGKSRSARAAACRGKGALARGVLLSGRASGGVPGTLPKGAWMVGTWGEVGVLATRGVEPAGRRGAASRRRSLALVLAFAVSAGTSGAALGLLRQPDPRDPFE